MNSPYPELKNSRILRESTAMLSPYDRLGSLYGAEDFPVNLPELEVKTSKFNKTNPKHVRDLLLEKGLSNLHADVGARQYMLESGYGKHTPNNNPFGITSSKGAQLATQEFENGKYVNTKRGFKQYSSISAAMDDYASLMAKKEDYSKYRKATDLKEATDALTGTYATDPQYGSKLRSIKVNYKTGGKIQKYQNGGEVNKQRIGNSNIYFDSSKTWKDANGNLTASDLATGKHYGIERLGSGAYNFYDPKVTKSNTYENMYQLDNKTYKKTNNGLEPLANSSQFEGLSGIPANLGLTQQEEQKHTFNHKDYDRPVNKPIYTSNPNDKRISNYNDSLYLNQKSLEQLNLPGINHKNEGIVYNFGKPESTDMNSKPIQKNSIRIKNDTHLNKYYDEDTEYSYDMFNNKLYPEGTVTYNKEEPKEWRSRYDVLNPLTKKAARYGAENTNAYYPNPVQPVYYKPKDKQAVIPKQAAKGIPTSQEIIKQNIITQEIPKTKVGMYRVKRNGKDEYISKEEYNAYMSKGKVETTNTGNRLDKTKYQLK